MPHNLFPTCRLAILHKLLYLLRRGLTVLTVAVQLLVQPGDILLKEHLLASALFHIVFEARDVGRIVIHRLNCMFASVLELLCNRIVPLVLTGDFLLTR